MPPRRPHLSSSEANARRALMLGGALLLLGLAFAGVGRATIASVVAIPGLVLMIFGIHTFGRLGPQEDGNAT